MKKTAELSASKRCFLYIAVQLLVVCYIIISATRYYSHTTTKSTSKTPAKESRAKSKARSHRHFISLCRNACLQEGNLPLEPHKLLHYLLNEKTWMRFFQVTELLEKKPYTFIFHDDYWDIPLIKEITSSALISTHVSVVVSHMLQAKYFILRTCFFHKAICLHWYQL